MPTFRVVVISRSVQAVNYQHRSDLRTGLRGTDLMPERRGSAGEQQAGIH